MKKDLRELTLEERLNLLDDGLAQNDVLYSILYDLVSQNNELKQKIEELERKVFPNDWLSSI